MVFPVVMVELKESVYKETVVNVAVADYSAVVVLFGILVVDTVVSVVNADIGAVQTVGVVQIVSAVWTAVVLVSISDLIETVSVGNVDAVETVIVEIVAHVFAMFVMTLNVFVMMNFFVLIAAGKTVLTLKSVVQSENLLDDTVYLVFCLVAAD